MASALPSLIGYSTHKVFRRAAIRRRQTSDAKFESSWTDITPFVKSWGTFDCAVDDVRLNRFTHSGLDLLVRNDTGAFNPESDGNSQWFGTLSRYRTLVRVQGGYEDEDGTELPTETTLGIFIITDEMPRSARTNQAFLKCKSLVSVFDEVPADEVVGLGVTLTASEIITKIRDHTDGTGDFVFREFITSTAWTIQSTSNNYNLATTTSGLANMSCWELMSKLAESEGFIVLINRTGGVEFRNRSERTTTAAFAFRGQGFVFPNVISLDEAKEAHNKLYNRIRFKYLEPDNATSYVEAGTATTVDPSSTSWKHGARTYDFENLFVTVTATAQSIVDNLFTAFSTLKEEVKITAKFIPHVEISDKVTLDYHSYDLASQDGSLWDIGDWASDTAVAPGDGMNWAAESGENFDYNSAEFKVLSRRTNLDNFTTEFHLRRI